VTISYVARGNYPMNTKLLELVKVASQGAGISKERRLNLSSSTTNSGINASNKAMLASSATRTQMRQHKAPKIVQPAPVGKQPFMDNRDKGDEKSRPGGAFGV